MNFLHKSFAPVAAAVIFTLNSADADASMAPLSVVQETMKTPKPVYAATFDSAASIKSFKAFAKGAETRVMGLIESALEQAPGSEAQAQLFDQTTYRIKGIEMGVFDKCAKFEVRKAEEGKEDSLYGRACPVSRSASQGDSPKWEYSFSRKPGPQ